MILAVPAVRAAQSAALSRLQGEVAALSQQLAAADAERHEAQVEVRLQQPARLQTARAAGSVAACARLGT